MQLQHSRREVPGAAAEPSRDVIQVEPAPFESHVSNGFVNLHVCLINLKGSRAAASPIPLLQRSRVTVRGSYPVLTTRTPKANSPRRRGCWEPYQHTSQHRFSLNSHSLQLSSSRHSARNAAFPAALEVAGYGQHALPISNI